MREVIEEVLQYARDLGAQFADIRLAEGSGTGISVQDGRADRVSTATAAGAGIRVLVDGAWGFAPTSDLSKEALRQCVHEAVSMARTAAPNVTDPGMVAEIEPVEDRVEAQFRVDPREIPLQDRVSAVYELERMAREYDPRIVNTVANYRDSAGTGIVANTAGTYLERSAVRCSVNVHVTAQEGEVVQTASKHKSNADGYELMQDLEPDFATAAAAKAVELLSAKRAPAGSFDVIIDPLICGLLVHEAFGHNCEADAVWSGQSILKDRIGERVAAECISIYDDPTLEHLNGAFRYDDEGTRAQKHVLVEEGILRGYLHSLETAARFGAVPEGSGRAQGYAYPPIVRMSNTYIAPGDWTFEEMVRDTKQGIYLKGGHWGYVFTARGQFTCNVENAYAIEDGELGQHYRNVCISGLTLETLMKVDAVGNDLKFELGGMCGKEGQSAPVDSGGPHIRARQVVVGGQE